MPEPPPIPTTVPIFSMCSGTPRGPQRSLMASPTLSDASIAVLLPTTWKMMVTVPLAASR